MYAKFLRHIVRRECVHKFIYAWTRSSYISATKTISFAGAPTPSHHFGFFRRHFTCFLKANKKKNGTKIVRKRKNPKCLPPKQAVSTVNSLKSCKLCVLSRAINLLSHFTRIILRMIIFLLFTLWNGVRWRRIEKIREIRRDCDFCVQRRQSRF